MPAGPGKYDDLCTHVRESAEALGAVVIVFNGNKGHGFSIQADPGTMQRIPELLEFMACEIRASQT